MDIAGNMDFLRALYTGGPFRGHGFIARPPQRTFCDHPDYDYTISTKPVAGWVPMIAENYRREMAMAAVPGNRIVPCARLMTGTHIYAAAFGCPVHAFPDSNACALPRVQSAAEADRLPEPDIWTSPTLYRIFELAEAVRKELGKDVPLGPPDVQSGFDTAALVWEKGGFLCAMVDEEESGAVQRLVDKTARLLKQFLLEFRKAFPTCSPCHCPPAWAPPELGPWLSNDECGAFGTDLFERFCLPELVDLATTFGGLGMHCCAAAEHQFPSFLRIPGFYAFNRVPVKQGFRPILDAFSGPRSPVHVLDWIGDADIETLIQAATPGTRFIFVRQAESAGDASRWLDRMGKIPGS